MNERLREIKASGEAKRDPAVNATMRRATEDLRASGLADRAIAVGARAPLFARPDIDGRAVRLAARLKRGPVVLSFFRGRW